MASKRAFSSLRFLTHPSLPHHHFITRLAPAHALQQRHNHPKASPLSQRRWNSQPPPQPPSSYPPTSPSSTSPPTIKPYFYSDILALTRSPTPSHLLIDVREPSELQAGHIPTARSLPITSNPDGLYLEPAEFQERFGWEKPGKGVELVFYCKAGVRARAAAKMAGGEGWRCGVYGGSWGEWVGRGGEGEGGGRGGGVSGGRGVWAG